MTKDDIIRMAHETHCLRVNLYTDQKASISRLERFAALVAAEEREACAQIAFESYTYIEAAKAIRARGKDD
jgi:hypothetical protein